MILRRQYHCGFFVPGSSKEKIATTLFSLIKNQVLHRLGAGVEESVPGQSMEKHKEPDDKKCIRTLIVGLTGDEACERITFGEEVRFEASSNNLGPRGKIDLVVGSRSSRPDMQICKLMWKSIRLSA